MNVLETTVQAVAAILKADPAINVRRRADFIADLRNGGSAVKPETQSERIERIIRRKEAAGRLSCSLRTIDKLHSQGILKKHKLPGRRRSSGFLESDVIALVTQREAA